MVEIYLLEQLVEFEKYGSLSEAAESLHLTQPTLTRSMKKLESLFDVTLFDHDKKNRISLNENGKLAAEYAKNILQLESQMVYQVKSLDMRNRSISIGSCAPGPLMELSPILTSSYPQMTIVTELKDTKVLIKELKSGIKELIITERPVDDPKIYTKKLGTEQLCATLVPTHPLAKESGIKFSDMNGEKFLMASEVGLWDNIVRKMMPDSTFLLQNSMEELVTLVEASSLPGFATDITIRVVGRRGPRISVPFTDKEATVTFYISCLKSSFNTFKPIL